MKRRLKFLAPGGLLLLLLLPFLRPAPQVGAPAPDLPAPVGQTTPLPSPEADRSEAPEAAPALPLQAGLRAPIVTAPFWSRPEGRGDILVKNPAAPRLERATAETSEVLIFLQPGTDPRAFARDLGLTWMQSLPAVADAHVLAAATPAAAKAALERARLDPRTARAFLNERTQHIHCAFVSNDPYFPDNSPAPFHGQWHLNNGASANHANVVAAWNRDYTGAGVLLGIVDDCLETAHPDLAPNYVAADSFNFGNGTTNPNANPAYDGTANEDRHGTSVSGVAGGRGGNGIGTTGAAPLAGLAGLRVDFPAQTTAMFVNATLYHSSSGNTNIKIKNHSYGVAATYIAAPAETQAVTDSTASGTIHLFAAGNERGTTAEDSNKTEPQNNPNAIAVAALGSDGLFAWYSSYGSNVFVTAPSSGIAGFGITTTDRVGNRGYNRTGSGDSDAFTDTSYTTTFGGTSSATPLTAGIMALAKQVRPALDVRLAKHALARSSTQVNPADNTATGGGDGATAGSAWKTNAAGFKFNKNYGFGLINADAFVQKVLQFNGVTPMGTESVGTTAVGVTIPDYPAAGITRTFPIATTSPLEEVLVTLDVTHPYRGDLEAYLTSPSGSTRRLFARTNDSVANFTWTFVSNEFWGENPAGTWTLLVQDFGPADIGTWNSYAITVRTGTVIADTTPPSVVSINRVSASPTNASSVSYTVVFSEPVTGVDAADFALTAAGVAGASVTGITGSLTTYTVTVNTGSGDGTLRLDVVDNDTIQDVAGNKLGGTGLGNGSFTTGQAYTFDRSAPAVTGVSSTAANGAYKAAASLPLTVAFSESVIVTGTPQLTVATGGPGTILNYSSGSGTATLTFNYIVGAGQNSPDLDYSSTSSLALNGGTIKDAVGNNAALALFTPGTAGSLGANKNLVVDTTAPGTPGTPAGAPNPNNSGSFLVSWSAASDGAGSGIASYTVQRSDNGGAFNTIASGVVATSLAQSGLAQGSYRYQVQALDLAGNAGLFSGISVPVVVDTAAPAPPSIPDLDAASDSGASNSDNVTNLTTLSFSGTAEAGATVQLFVDGIGNATGVAAAGSWTILTTPLAAGLHSVTARASDAAGNLSGSSGALSVTVDLALPGAPSTPDLATASDTGASSSDNLTNLTTLSFSGSAEAGSSVQLVIDGLPDATGVAAGGAWTIVASPLGAGVHSVSARATDAAGNLGPASGALSVTIDTTLPAAPSVPDLDPASDSGASNSDNFTNLTTLSFSGTAEAGSSVQLFIDGVGGPTTTAAGGAWTIVASSLAPGLRSISARATDPAGNLGPASAALSVTIDTSAPAAPSAPDLSAATDTGASSSDNVTSSLAPQFAVTGEAGGLLTLFAGATPVGTAGDSGGGNYSLTIDATPLANTTVVFSARITDAAGNPGPLSPGLSVTFDTLLPTSSAPDLDAASDSGASSSDNLTKLTSLSFSGTAEAGATVQLFVDGVAGATTTAAGGVWTIVAPSVAPGVRSITSRATDLAGNLGPLSPALSVTVDISAPLAPSIPDLDAASDSGTSNSDNVTSLTTLSFSGSAEAGSSVQLFIDGLPGATTTAAGGAWTLVASGVAPGVRSFAAQATDPAGNVGPLSGALPVTIDTSVPAVPSVPHLTVDPGLSNSDNITNNNAPALDGSAEAGATVQLIVDGVPGPTTIAAGGVWSFTAPTLADGVHTFAARAGDAAGNQSAASANLSVTIDTAAPAAPSVPDLDAASDTGASATDNLTSLSTLSFSGSAETGAQVRLFVDGVAGSATIAAGGSWTLSAAGLGAGLHNFSARVTDAAGNVGPLSAALAVTIDLSAPAPPSTPDLDPASDSGISNSDNVTSLTTLSFSGTAEAGATVQLFIDAVPGATTTAAGGTWTLVAPGVAPGVHAVTARATDPAGNLGPASAALSVTVDSTLPAAPSVPDLDPAGDSGSSNADNITNLTTLSFSGSAEAGVRVQLFVDGVGGATTVAAGGAWTLVASSLSPGVRSITARATDDAGNLGPASGALSVTIDTSAPAPPSTPDLVAASDSGASSSDNLTSILTPTFSVTGEAGGVVQLFADGVLAASASEATPGNYLVTVPSGISTGTTVVFTAKVVDAAGNVSAVSAAGLSVTFDATAPAVPSLPDLDAASDTGVSASDNITNLTTLSFSGTAEAGSTVQLLVDGVPGATTTAAGGAWTIVAASLAPGVRSITARASDPAGNVSAASGALSVTIDATPPAVPSVPDLDPASDSGVSNSDNLTNLSTLTFSGTAEAGATVQLLVDGIPGATTIAAGGAWTLSAPSLAPGARLIRAVAADAAGNTSAASGALTVTIDTTLPAAPSTPDLDPASDSGASNSDNLTSLTTLSFSGTAEAGATVQLFIDGAPGSTAVAGGGAWTIVAAALAPGVRSISARATDAAGNLGPASAALPVTIDTSLPATPSLPDLDAASDSGASNSDNLTSVLTPSFSGSAEAGVQVKLFANGVLVGSATATAGGLYTVVSSALAEGTWAITATATDAAGNASPASAALSVTIDATPPAAPSVPDLDPASDTGSSSSDNHTNLTALSFSGTAEPGTTVQLFIDGVGGGTTVAAAVSGAWTILASPLVEGAHAFSARAQDGAGNLGPLSAGLPVTIDTTPPAAPSVPDLDAASDTGASSSDNVTSLATLSFSGTAEAGATVQLFIDGAPGAVGLANGSGAWTIVTAPLAAGPHNVTAQAKDSAGNTGPISSPLPVTIDLTAPPAPSVPDLDAASDTGASNSDNLTRLTTLSFSGSAEAGALVQLLVDGAPGPSATAAGGSWTIVVSALASGVHAVAARATDAAGNAGPASAALSVTIDTTAPAAPSVPDLGSASDSGASSSDNLTNLTTLSFSGSAEAGSSVQLFIDGVAGATTSAAAGAWTLAAAALAEGVHAVTAVATDSAGNAGPASGALSVTIDLSPPVAPSIPDLDAASDTGASSSDNLTKLATLSFSGSAETGSTVRLFVDGAPAALTTAVAGAWTLSATGVAEGVHLVTAAATDAAGNVGPASVALSVTVDTTAPAAPSVPDLAAASDTGASNTDNLTSLTTLSFSGTAEAGATVQLFVDGVAGNSSTAAAGNWTLAASSLSPGVHAITARASDAAGNLSPVSSALSVTIDATAPTVPSIPDLDAASDSGVSNSDNLTKLTTLSFSGTAEDGSTVRLFVDGSSAGTALATGGAWTIVASSLTPGAHTITANAVDPAGNLSATSGGLVVTIDTTPPPLPPAPGLDAASDTGLSSTDRITTLHALSVSGSVEAGAAVQLFAGALPVGSVVAGAGGAYTVASSALADGAHSLTVTATDAAGNVSAASAPLAVIIDNTPPPAGVVQDGPGVDLAFQNSATTIVAHWSGFDDPLSGIFRYEIAIGTTPGGTQVQGYTDVGTLTSLSAGPFALVEGATYYVSVRATNPVDFQSTATSDGVTVDLTPPAAPASIGAIPGDLAATVFWSASPSADTAFYRLWWKPAGAAWAAATLLDNLTSLTATVTGLLNGTLYDFRLRAVDAAGNESGDLFASATPQPAIRISGGGSFATIQQAIDAALPGQTVLIGPGTYVGDLVLHAGVSLQGYSPYFTILQGSGLGPVITVEGTFGSGLSSTISQVTITGGLVGVSSPSADLTIRNGVIHHVAGHGVLAGAAGRLSAVNVTTMSNAGDGIRSLGVTIVRNTIAGQNAGMGLNLPAAATVTYSDSYGNTGGNYSVGAGATGNLSAAAIFGNQAANDYTTPAASPTVDAGDPADDFSGETGLNGGRVDQGAYGNTAFAPQTTAPPPPPPPPVQTAAGGGGGGGGGCGLLGLDAVLLIFLLGMRRGRRRRIGAGELL